MPVIDLGQVAMRGPKGDPGEPGAASTVPGPAGPNAVSGATTTPFTGVLAGNGTKVVEIPSDDQPTEDSPNIIRSGPVYNALAEKSGENFIANWYFYGGGGGRGIMPVNQRGQTSYSGGSTIDGWRANSYITVTLGSTYMRLAGGSSAGYLRYWVRERPSGWITFSALVRGNGVGYVGLQGYANDELQSLDSSARAVFSEPGSAWTLVTGSYQAAYADVIRVFVLSVNPGTQFDVLAVKLERGRNQTLAHREGRSWVLNDTPDYDLALLRGQLNSGYASEPLANHFIATAEMLGPVEVGTTASRAYTTGKIFVWNGLLYKAKTSIASGATLTVGTNCEQTTLAALLNM